MTSIQFLSSQIRSGKLNPRKVSGEAIASAIAQEFVLEWDEAESLASQALLLGRDWATVRQQLLQMAGDGSLYRNELPWI